MNNLNIPIIYSRIISSMTAKSPAEIREILAGTGLEKSQYSRSNGYMNNAQYEQLLSNAYRVSCDPLFALKAGLNTPLSVHGPLGLAVVSSPTLIVALETFAHYVKLRTPFCDCYLKTTNDKIFLSLNMTAEFGRHSDTALDFILASIAKTFPLIASGLPLSFELQLRRSKPANNSEYEKLLGCRVNYQKTHNRFIFEAHDSNRKSIAANTEEFNNAIDRLRVIYSSFIPTKTAKEAVLNVFIKNIGRLCSLEDVADQMSITTRTLQRRLVKESISFQQLRDDWLSKMATKHLQQEGLTIDVTAALLGYSDSANFRRSFKRWFGLSPREYCRNN